MEPDELLEKWRREMSAEDLQEMTEVLEKLQRGVKEALQNKRVQAECRVVKFPPLNRHVSN